MNNNQKQEPEQLELFPSWAMSTDFPEWVAAGKARGWVSDVVCSMHEGLPTTEEEDEELDQGDPCLPAMRVWLE